MTPQELKNSILQLAIQGKLVEQRPEEGTAAELVEKILAAKNAKSAKKNLTRSRGGRGENKTSALSAAPREKIPDDEKPFDIPESWEWVRLEEVISLLSGRDLEPSEYSATPKKYPYMTGASNFANGNLLVNRWTDRPVTISHMGDLLITCKGTVGAMAFNAIGDIHIARQIMAISSASIDLHYVKVFLAASVQSLKAAANSMIPGIDRKTMLFLPIPLPPLAEQKRIVAKIEELLPLIDRYEKAWSKLEDFNKRFPVDMQKSLLQMAIQGKLVDHRPEEGTGEELYRQIQAEKQRLVKSGKIKKEKPLPEITEDEIPFEIPDSWKWVRIGNIGSWSSGATPSRTHAEYYGGNIPWLKTGDLNDGYVSSIPETITDLALEKTSVRLNPIGSVLMAMYGATIGKLGILQVAATTNQACCACIPYDGMWNKYLFYFLMASRRAFIKMGEGGAQPNISKEKIVNAVIPLPPLAEQKRIVAKLEELLPLCERLK